jgi:thiamine biosynthesis lipoprotein
MRNVDRIHLKAALSKGMTTTHRDNDTNKSIPGTKSRLDSASRSLRPSLDPEQEEVSEPDLIRAETSIYCMGTMFHIVTYGSRREHIELAIAEALGEARRLDGMLSNYRPESELSQLNRLAGRSPIRVSSELFQFLSACLAYSRASEGSFDVTVGPLVKVSGFYNDTGRLPQHDEVLWALGKVGYRNLILDEQNTTARFAQEGMELDPGGIGKGFAADKMAEILRRAEVYSALISAGGSTIYALGAPPNQPGWKVTIKDPRKPSTTIETVRLKNEAVSTSGNYEKFFWADGKVWGHILDPRTGYPARGTLAVSVFAPQAVDSEAWTKPYCIQGRAWTEKHKPRSFRVFYCEDKPSAPCAWL